MNLLRPTTTFGWPLTATLSMALVLSPVATAEEARSIPAGQRQLFLEKFSKQFQALALNQ